MVKEKTAIEKIGKLQFGKRWKLNTNIKKMIRNKKEGKAERFRRR